ncbi:MAG: DUF2182 domain-containing protein [Gammaproteobacteria bacterium]
MANVRGGIIALAFMLERMRSYAGGAEVRDVAAGGLVSALAVLAVVGFGVFCWWLTAVMAADFYDGGMTSSAGGGLMSSFGAIFVMWAVMMAAMMIPSFLPSLLLFARWQKNKQAQPSAAAGRLWALTFGYLAAWAGFSFAAAVFQHSAQLNSALLLEHPLQRAGLLFAAGVFQFSRLKLRCLRGCRHPALFFVLHWRGGAGGAFRMGMHNGALCVGCCGLLMALLFVGGVMDMRWIAALALWALAEKTLPFSARKTAACAGLLLFAAAAWEVAAHYS